MENKPTLWLRSEYKPNEARTPITPQTAKSLIDAGYNVVVEQSKARAFADHAFVDAGCTLVEEHTWPQAPTHAIIIGLKELSADLGPFEHRHVHFAHVFKYQDGWEAVLNQFSLRGGKLFDLEYLVDEQGRRIAAFGYWAGYVGAAIALLQWASQQRNATLGALVPWSSRDELHKQVSQALSQVSDQAGSKPNVLVIGAKGRSGGGAVELCERCGVEVTQWDMQETSAGGPFDKMLSHDVMINCVFLNSPIPPFTTHAHLQNPARRLSVISDVSCDPFSDANPLPIYSSCTTMDEPSLRIVKPAAGTRVLDLISIDHLPSLLPVESSEEFATALLPYLLQVDHLNAGVWQRAAAVFNQKCAEAKNGVKA